MIDKMKKREPIKAKEMDKFDRLLYKAEERYPGLTHKSTISMWIEITGKGKSALIRFFEGATGKQRFRKRRITSAFLKLKMKRALEQAEQIIKEQPEQALKHDSCEKLVKTLFNDKIQHFYSHYKPNRFQGKIEALEKAFAELK